MALPASGPISLSQINIELGLVSTAEVNLSDVAVRALFGVASGAIRLGGDGHGKSSAFAAAITANQTNLNLRTFAVNAGWNQSAPATITVNAGVYVYATSTGNAGMTIDGSWPGGVTVVNNGFVIGQGGAGHTTLASGAAQAGGAAISLGVNCTITNNSGAFVAGGGGGGGGNQGGGGGGAGGGVGGAGRNQQPPFVNGGAPGSAGTVGQIGVGCSGGGGGGSGGGGGGFFINQSQSLIPYGAQGGGGGRILPGTGGAGGYGNTVSGAGGGTGSGGGGSLPSGAAGAGGGGWGASGGNGDNGGGSGGQAIQRNGYTVTTSGAGTTYGAIS